MNDTHTINNMFILNILSKLIKALRSGDSPGQIAAGFCVGVIIGIMPGLTLQGIILFLLLIFVNINFAAGILGMILANLLAYLLDGLFHDIGFFILTGVPFLKGVWEFLYNLPIAPMSRFNNTVVLGSFVTGLVLFTPLYWAVVKFVMLYRTKLEDRIKRMKIVKIISGSKIVRFYQKIRDLGGN